MPRTSGGIVILVLAVLAIIALAIWISEHWRW